MCEREPKGTWESTRGQQSQGQGTWRHSYQWEGHGQALDMPPDPADAQHSSACQASPPHTLKCGISLVIETRPSLCSTGPVTDLSEPLM